MQQRADLNQETKADPSVTMGDVFDLIAKDQGLTDQRRKNLLSSLRTLGKATGRELHDMPAQPGEIRALLKEFHPARLNITIRRWRNIKSDLLYALRRVSLEPTPGQANGPLSPAWQALSDRLPGWRYRSRLSRFMSFCTRWDIAPEDVCDNVFNAFLDALVNDSFLRDPVVIHRKACLRWNEAVETVPGWPQIKVAVPDNRKHGLPWEVFPTSFRADVTAWLDSLGGTDTPFADEGPDQPLSPATIKRHRSGIRTIATALVRSGREPETITNLRALVEPETARAALQTLWEDQGREKSQALYQKATLLLNIARHWVGLDPSNLDELAWMRKKLSDKTWTPRLSDKNMRRLRPLMNPINARRLVRWPEDRARDIERNDTGTRQEAIDYAITLAIQILLYAPIRLQNLHSIDMERNLAYSGKGRSKIVHLVFPPEQIKNNEDLEFELTTETVRMLECYRKRFRPRLLDGPSPWLFPGQNGGPKSAHTLAIQVEKTILEGVGYKMTCHLFRHFGAIQYLKRNPGDYETVRRVLGHRSLVAIRYYSGLEKTEAAKHYDETILELRQQSGKMDKA